MVHPEKFKNLLSMPAQDRYGYFIRRVADAEQVWGLRTPDGRWIVSASDNGVTVYPFWPEKEFAEAAVFGDWSDATAVALPLEEFLERWLPGMQEAGEM